MNFKNKAYSNTGKSSSKKDMDSFWYHTRQEQQQDRLIKQWQQSVIKSKQTQG